MTRRALSLLAVAALAALTVGVMKQVGVGRGLELETVDARFRIRGPVTPPADVVLVQVDETTLSEMQQRWPFPRAQQARPDRPAGGGEAARDRDRPPVHRADHRRRRQRADRRDRQRRPRRARHHHGRRPGRHERARGRRCRQRHRRARRQRTDADRSGRRDPARGLPGRRPRELRGRDRRGGDESPGRSVRRRPHVDRLRGPAADRCPPTRIRRCCTDTCHPRRSENKIVVVGTEALRLKDASTTSTTDGSLMSGPEVQGNAIATVLANLPLRSPGGIVGIALIVLMAALAPLAAAFVRPLGAVDHRRARRRRLARRRPGAVRRRPDRPRRAPADRLRGRRHRRARPHARRATDRTRTDARGRPPQAAAADARRRDRRLPARGAARPRRHGRRLSGRAAGPRAARWRSR